MTDDKNELDEELFRLLEWLLTTPEGQEELKYRCGTCLAPKDACVCDELL